MWSLWSRRCGCCPGRAIIASTQGICQLPTQINSNQKARDDFCCPSLFRVVRFRNKRRQRLGEGSRALSVGRKPSLFSFVLASYQVNRLLTRCRLRLLAGTSLAGKVPAHVARRQGNALQVRSQIVVAIRQPPRDERWPSRNPSYLRTLRACTGSRPASSRGRVRSSRRRCSRSGQLPR